MQKRIAILGSTGSIGKQSLEVIAKYPGRFEVEVLTANNNTSLLIEQAKMFLPDIVVIGNESKYTEVKEALAAFPVKVFAGLAAIDQVVQMESLDMVLTAMVGYAGVIPTMKAIEAGKQIALANKETLVVAGELITKLAAEKKAAILPVDSEHSAIFQCLAGEFLNPPEKIILTCSGGPFRGKKREELQHVTPAHALAHPNWDMGAKITVDSATLMNKGFEMIEARWLFSLDPGQIEVVVHPQSVIHSMVQFFDGSIKAQLGLPDMRLPILYALGYPERLSNDLPRFSFLNYPSLTFESPDLKNFRNLALAFESIRIGGNIPCVLNAANEIVVGAFLNNRIGFNAMPEIIEEILADAEFIPHPVIEELVETNRKTRETTELLISAKY
jgi:1-deoxy-D-xylulose-5-phosphate reductoisomerase